MLAFRPAKFDCDISTLGISGFAETLAEGSYTACEHGRRFGAKISDDRHRRLLRPRRGRPSGCRATEQRDEIAAFYLIELHSVPVSQGRIAGYQIGADQSAGIGAQPVSHWRGRPMSALGHSRPTRSEPREHLCPLLSESGQPAEGLGMSAWCH